ncbi:MAG: sulfurtransferase TusA family protein [Fimbriimonadaceae bacterium]|nr:sulfurtransferase TusA family protein [Alphaproteobacteria bacterium]
MADHTLDTRGMNCPIPVLKTRKVLKDIPKGETLEVLATDPGSIADVAAFCEATENKLIESENDGDVYRYVIERG